jgi:hypothetical protein
MWALVFSLHLISIPASAADAMNFIKEDIKPVIEFSMDWAMKAALAATSTHAFIVLAKRFID